MQEEAPHISKGLREGRENAWKDLFGKYYRPLTAYAHAFVQDLDTAREIVQDLFVHIYEARKELQIQSSLKSYLYRSVRNRCLNHLEQESSRKSHHESMKHELPGEANLEEEIRKNELEHRIFQIINSLPEKCRRVFILSRVKGLSNEEIARNLDISKRTVETQISRALKMLREKIS